MEGLGHSVRFLRIRIGRGLGIGREGAAKRDITATLRGDFHLRRCRLLEQWIRNGCKMLINSRHFDSPGDGDTEIRGCQESVSGVIPTLR